MTHHSYNNLVKWTAPVHVCVVVGPLAYVEVSFQANFLTTHHPNYT